MTSKRKRFIDEYITCRGNGAEAARRAGYSAATAKQSANQLLNRSDVRSAIDDRLDELKTERTADAQEVLELLTAIARGEVEDTVVVPSGKIIKVPPRISERLRAAETLLKVFGAFREKVDVKLDTSTLLLETLEKIANED